MIESQSAENKRDRDSTLAAVVEALQEVVTVIQLSAKFVGNFAMNFPLPSLTAKSPLPADDKVCIYGSYN
jgi:hypothetical protein